MQRLYYYPPIPRWGRYDNPYSANYRQALASRYRVVNLRGAVTLALSLSFVLNSFRADVYIINWLENIAYFRLGALQFVFVRLGLWVIRLRRKRIVWMFHNIHPHQGHNRNSRWLHRYLFAHASLIISHSQEAADYARQHTSARVLYVCHPVEPVPLKGEAYQVEPADVLIWGSIIPYKGILEFLQAEQQRSTSLRIHILGKCQDGRLAAQIAALCDGRRIRLDNRWASFDEVAACIRRSRYVLFPYVGSCVSSSGALIDTVVLGGTPVGPRVGAFKDLEEEGVCLTYTDYDDLFRLLADESRPVSPQTRQSFVERNSWDRLVEVLHDNLEISS